MATTLGLGLGIALLDAPWSRFPELGCAVMLAILLTRRRHYPVGSVVLVVLLCVWFSMSELWSLLPSSTIIASVRTVLALAAAALLLRTQPWRRLVVAVTLGTSALCAMSLIWLAMFPATATSIDGLRGMMPHKNSLGYVAAVATVSSVFARALPRLVQLVLIALDITTLVLTLSMTSLLASIAAIVCSVGLLLLRRLSGRRLAALGVLLVGLLGALAYLSAFVSVTTVVGRTSTLTGRTGIWSEVLRVATQRWLTGWGHGAPWLEGSWIRSWAEFRFNFSMISAHNALLETFLQLGLVGVLLVLLLWAVGLCRVVSGAWRSGTGGWVVALAVLQLLHGIVEATQGAPLGWFIAALIWMARPTGLDSRPLAPGDAQGLSVLRALLSGPARGGSGPRPRPAGCGTHHP